MGFSFLSMFGTAELPAGNNATNFFFNLGAKSRFPELYEQALPLRRQLGDHWGESITRYNMDIVYQSLNRLDETDSQFLGAVGHPHLESDRAAQEEVRAAWRAQANDSWPASASWPQPDPIGATVPWSGRRQAAADMDYSPGCQGASQSQV